MSNPFTISGALNFPTGPGVPVVPIPFNLNGQYNSEGGGAPLIFGPGSGSASISLGSVPAAGLKGLLVIFDAVSPVPNTTPSPIMLQFNGGSTSGQQEISPGGMYLLGSPSPVAGITALVIVYSSNARVWVYALS